MLKEGLAFLFECLFDDKRNKTHLFNDYPSLMLNQQRPIKSATAPVSFSCTLLPRCSTFNDALRATIALYLSSIKDTQQNILINMGLSWPTLDLFFPFTWYIVQIIIYEFYIGK